MHEIREILGMGVMVFGFFWVIDKIGNWLDYNLNCPKDFRWRSFRK